MLPFTDFGGSGPTLHLAHANGYPPQAYGPLIETLTPHYRVVSMLARPLWPNAQPDGLRDWQPLVDDLVQFLDSRGEAGIAGAGHSLGAMTTLLAALRRPDLFRAIVAIDPGLLSPLKSIAWGWIKRLGLVHRFHPYAGLTLKRRRVFQNVEAMYRHYRPKALFERVDDRGVRAYAEALARLRPDGQVELAYPPEWEVWIYETMPHDLWSQVGDLQVPLLLVYGEDSNTFRPSAARALRRVLPQAELYRVPGAGHLVPLEQPREIGEAIMRFLAKH